MPLSEDKQIILDKYYKCVAEGKRSFHYYIRKEYLFVNGKAANQDKRMGIVDIHKGVLDEFTKKNLGSISLNTMTKWIPLHAPPLNSSASEPESLKKNTIDEFQILVGKKEDAPETIKMSVSGLTRKQRSDKGQSRIKKIDEFKQL